MRVFTGFQLSNVVIPSVNEFIASPTVHCFAYARGTNDHHPASGASVSEANRGRRRAKPSDDGMTTRKSIITHTNGQILPSDPHQSGFLFGV